MDRREFVTTTLAVSGSLLAGWHRTPAAEPEQRRVMTVTGEAAADDLGPALPHEHVLVDFIGADRVNRNRYDPEEVIRTMAPHLVRLRELGCRTLFECTPAYLARDPLVLQRLARATDVRLVTNTGYYGAREGKYLPAHAHRESAEELAARWTREGTDGIEGTTVRPGFIKIGVDGAPLNEVSRKLVRAAAHCHRHTGLTIAAHTGDGGAALEQAAILESEGVALAAWIWVHAHNESDLELHLQLARRGAWVEFDGIRPDTVDRHVALASHMRRAELLDRLLVSQDAGWYSVGEPQGGAVRPYDTLFTAFLPALRDAGWREDEIRQLTVVNPARAFSRGVKAR